MIPLSGLSNPLEGALLLLLLPVAGLKNPLGGHNNLLEGVVYMAVYTCNLEIMLLGLSGLNSDGDQTGDPELTHFMT